MSNAIQRLEEWQAGHKSRSVKIYHDDGYGASCWQVILQQGRKIVHASAAKFHEGPSVLRDVDFVSACPAEEDWLDLPGTIDLALKHAAWL